MPRIAHILLHSPPPISGNTFYRPDSNNALDRSIIQHLLVPRFIVSLGLCSLLFSFNHFLFYSFFLSPLSSPLSPTLCTVAWAVSILNDCLLVYHARCYPLAFHFVTVSGSSIAWPKLYCLAACKIILTLSLLLDLPIGVLAFF